MTQLCLESLDVCVAPVVGWTQSCPKLSFEVVFVALIQKTKVLVLQPLLHLLHYRYVGQLCVDKRFIYGNRLKVRCS